MVNINCFCQLNSNLESLYCKAGEKISVSGWADASVIRGWGIMFKVPRPTKNATLKIESVEIFTNAGWVTAPTINYQHTTLELRAIIALDSYANLSEGDTILINLHGAYVTL